MIPILLKLNNVCCQKVVAKFKVKECTHMKDLGLDKELLAHGGEDAPLDVASDSSAALAFAQQKG